METNSKNACSWYILFVALTLHLALPAASGYTLTVDPQRSSAATTVQSLPNGISADITPASVALTGTISISSTNLQGPVTFDTSSFVSFESAIAVKVTMGGAALATATVTNPKVLISGGSFTPSPADGSFAFTPTAATIGADSIAGQALGNPVNNADVSYHIPSDQIPVLKGTIASQASNVVLTLTGTFTVKIRDVLAASGASSSIVSAAGDGVVVIKAAFVAEGAGGIAAQGLRG
eukprot:TRINITY_DN22327_c0_g1_i1.p1 TRINITY_DN22327_c0_g1~~TRINITY_DN22327_c0_g1_i1.p1  ORF type:complete len:236 (+),score=14.24 TRINITY_DN22327_c0_g1_i1:80-787(+)